jgi:hypothetical protein
LESPACAVEHRTAAAIVESAGSGDESIPIPEAIPYSAPEGIPADPATIERAPVLAESLVGCVNGGDIVGFMSLLSNDFLRRHFSDFDLSLEEMTQLAATPTPLDEQLVLVAISDVTELPDGRIRVLVLLDQGEIESPELNSLLTLVETEGHLLIDEWQPVLIERGGEGDGLQVVCGEGDGWQMVCGEGYEGVIVPADQVGDFMRGLMGTPVQGSWTPTPEQIATLESTLPTYLKSAPNAAADLHERVGDYQRQYAGYVTEGRALIMVNAFCSSPGADWTSQPVFVADGGDCFFSVSYEPASGSFEDLRINGDA